MGHRGHNLMLNIVNRIVSLFKFMHCIPWSIWCDRRKPCENHKVISSMAIKIILSLATFSGGKRMRIQMKKEAWVLLKFCIWIHLPNVGSPVVAGPVPCLDKMSLLRMQLTQFACFWVCCWMTLQCLSQLETNSTKCPGTYKSFLCGSSFGLQVT